MKRGLIIFWLLISILSAGCSVLDEHKEARSVFIEKIDFGKIRQGVYIGEYSGGMYRWRENKVRITAENGRVLKIEKVYASEKTEVEELYNRVIENQSLQVDGIAGATLTSKAFLKGIENGLKKGIDLK